MFFHFRPRLIPLRIISLSNGRALEDTDYGMLKQLKIIISFSRK